MRNNDFFSQFNDYLRTLPEDVHTFTWIIMLMLYTQLFYGAFLERHRMSKGMKRYFILRSIVMITYLMIKAIDTRYGMFDLFLITYILSYTDGLMILKGSAIRRCKTFTETVKKLTKFTSKKE